MVSTSTLCKNLLNVKDIVIKDVNFQTDERGVQRLLIKARPHKRLQGFCPHCGQKCPGYDHRGVTRKWRALDCGGTIVEIESTSQRICCPRHGVVVASVPWAFHGSGFTKEFEYSTAWLATQLNKSAVAAYMRVAWDTVGRIMSRVHKDIEPNLRRRLDGLRVIGIDETSYRKGHKYITVVVNHETNTVVWAHEGKGKTVLTCFMELLSQEQRESIQVVSADGARWITECVEKYLLNCERCVDAFHVVEWAMDALDAVRRQSWREAQAVVKALPKPEKTGRPQKDDTHAVEAAAAKQKATSIKGSAYALGKAPENLTETQKAKLELIQLSDNQLYRAYKLKEALRLIFHMTDVDEADGALTKWVKWARHCRIPKFVELQRKIMRHRDHILNTIRQQVSNARIEANNNKIKLIIRRSFGFRNIQNMLDMILLVCSDIDIPLPNRPVAYMA